MSDAIDRFLVAAAVLERHIDVRRFPEGTRTAGDAARAIGCDVSQIVKSLVFMADGRALLALTSGANRVDPSRLATLTGASTVRRADADEVRRATGFAIGGTPPFGHRRALPTYLDEDLLSHEEVWAAAGAPDAVYRTTPQELLTMTGATASDFKER